MRLYGVEVRRLLSRRLFRIMLLLVFLGLAVVLGTTAYESKPPSAAERAQAEAQVEESRRQMPPIEEQIKECEREEQAQGVPAGEFGCDQIRAPQAADFLQDKTFRFRPDIADRVISFGVVLALFGFVVGASFIGAEWTAGTLAALLTWEPRRLRVLLAKILGLATVVGIAGVLVMAADIGGHAAVAAWRGDTTGMTDGLLISSGLTALRGIALAVTAALIGFAIAGTTRNTAAALGTGFAYFLGAELMLRSFWEGSTRWLLTSNVGSWLSKELRIPVASDCPPTPRGECTIKEIVISMGDGAAYFGVLVAVLLLICAAIFRRRDVT